MIITQKSPQHAHIVYIFGIVSFGAVSLSENETLSKDRNVIKLTHVQTLLSIYFYTHVLILQLHAHFSIDCKYRKVGERRAK